jgi:hypothetical protein
VPHSAEGHPLSGFHAAVGIAVLATNLAAQAAVVVQVVLGLLLVARGASAPDGLHIVYGVSPLIVTLFSEGMRVAVAQRELEEVDDIDALDRPEQVALAKRVALGEMGVMTVGALLILTLALRAFQTGG